ncbi:MULTISPECIES: translation initiation factor IF-2 subunit gamma [Methanosphaera]|uniref:Translation initiation factor 2 subunit gamma n=1 Tax=Methanosphaera stadtmanae (strain ATCC 43021 / DSM 3091 / JCM 11832 / MCB-3) TaxID=339860 RepID=Q2NGM8_METST|nr:MULTISPECIES: translation initiation factor IF-2 subunit gamma [Methanosphaera]ABC57025.1 putative translation initiation factor 2, subunit gamma (aIF-2-gamma)(eIF2G) [Methanosphaera stadtmanae DSM 3091]MDO5822675.1 translation initiation factor IF-2 subunit gamma [Methanosphaera sp.]MEE0488933.1 translation initiation factor IF-2 subunit gamma [Methanosphaera stadtmanae]OEC90575.1 translation initiation factor IF-2 subunit gamma [Methanosphaera sp. A6]RAP47814.1 MAG: translation initiation
MKVQSEINIGLVGHVDHGKTTLTKALSGIWTDTHSEEAKRGISIRLGYADITFRTCPECPAPQCYTTKETCEHCGSKTEILRKVSFVDSPGHETLMATMLSGAAIMDGAILVIGANEPCPQPQTKEHLMALDVIGVKNVIVVQNKVDTVPKEKAIENYYEIKEFVKGTCADGVPIIPISAQQGANIDVLIETIQKNMKTPRRSLRKNPKLYVARSFDINKPGTHPKKINGGIIGGSLIQGKLKLGDEIEIKPGIQVKNKGKTEWKSLTSTITGLEAANNFVDEVGPGGLIGVALLLDPSLTKSDSLSGSIAGKPGTLPPTIQEFTMETHLLDRVVGTKNETDVEPIHSSENLMINIGTTTTVGLVSSARGDEVDVKLRLPVCAEDGQRVALSRRVGARWRLIGYGIIKA